MLTWNDIPEDSDQKYHMSLKLYKNKLEVTTTAILYIINKVMSSEQFQNAENGNLTKVQITSKVFFSIIHDVSIFIISFVISNISKHSKDISFHVDKHFLTIFFNILLYHKKLWASKPSRNFRHIFSGKKMISKTLLTYLDSEWRPCLNLLVITTSKLVQI